MVALAHSLAAEKAGMLMLEACRHKPPFLEPAVEEVSRGNAGTHTPYTNTATLDSLCTVTNQPHICTEPSLYNDYSTTSTLCRERKSAQRDVNSMIKCHIPVNKLHTTIVHYLILVFLQMSCNANS